MKYLIVTGGTVSKKFFETVLLKYEYDKLIACDKGLEHCQSVGVVPDIVIGDFDSAEKDVVAEYRDLAEVNFLELPAEKDVTDTEFAVDYVLEEMDGEDTQVLILGATGTRLDHTMANVGLLKKFAAKGIRAWIADEHNVVGMLAGCESSQDVSRIEGFDFVSFLPFEGAVEGVTLEGFKYSGEGIVLKSGESLGVSNEFTCERGHIHFANGYLLMIYSKD